MSPTRFLRRPRRAAVVAVAVTAVVATVAGLAITSGTGSPPPALADGAAATAAATAGVEPVPATTEPAPTVRGATDGTGTPGAAELVGLQLTDTPAPAADPVDVAEGTELGADDIRAIARRLPPLRDDSDEQPAFRWPARTLLPGVPGVTTTVDPPADPDAAPPVTPAGPLQVLRMQPQGAVSVAPFISITFDRPVVPLATVGSAAAQRAPATITPAVEGSWQWIGTSTARFVAATGTDRMPMATRYTVTVPAGTRAADGSTLAAASTAVFTTPVPTVKRLTGTGTAVDLDSVFVAEFDQRVDPAAVLRRVVLLAGAQRVAVRLATEAEIAAHPRAAQAVAAAPDGRAVAFRADRPLPTDAPLQLTFRAGIPSAEGPLTSTAERVFTGRTYGPLRFGSLQCGRCETTTPWRLGFSNPLDAAAFDPATVTITPEIPGGASITVQRNVIVVSGAPLPRTDYRVTVAAGLRDVHGQRLATGVATTVTTAPPRPLLGAFPQSVLTVDPFGDTPSVPVVTVNRSQFRERVFRVSLAEWGAYLAWSRNLHVRDTGRATPPPVGWQVLRDRIVTPQTRPDTAVTTQLDLSGLLTTDPATSAVVVLLENTDADFPGSADRWQNLPTVAWVQRTSLGLDSASDATGARIWATDLRTGDPLPGVRITPLSTSGSTRDARTSTTDADGVAQLELTVGGDSAMLARSGENWALLTAGWGGWEGAWGRQQQTDRWLWYVMDDRQTYRPGETVTVKGWLRRQAGDSTAALSLPKAGRKVSWSLVDGRGVTIAASTTTVTAQGGFDLRAGIPAGANLGRAGLHLRMEGEGPVADTYHSVTIADFVTPAFEVSTRGVDPAPYLRRDAITIGTDATYYAGGPVADAPVQWQLRTATATYRPPGWDQFTFGRWSPWWQSDAATSLAGDLAVSGPSVGPGRWGTGDPCCENPDAGGAVETRSGTTDADGRDRLELTVGDLREQLGADSDGLPVTVTAQASVTDVDRASIAGRTDLLVHPAADYVGLAGDDTFVQQGSPLVVRAVATDVDGAVAPGRPVRIEAVRLVGGGWGGAGEKTVGDPEVCRLTSAAEPVSCSFRPAVAGTYRITATVTDAAGRTARSELTRWVSGPTGSAASTVGEQALTLVPQREEYAPGDTAAVLVQSPISRGTGLATVVHQGIRSTVRFAVADGAGVVRIPVDDAAVPAEVVSVEVVGAVPLDAADPDGGSRPAFAMGRVALRVSTAGRRLDVSVTPRERTVAPGGSTTVDVRITDAAGEPVAGSEFALVAVDEAVLAVGGQVLPDPVDVFHPELESWLAVAHSRAGVLLPDGAPPQPGQTGGYRTAMYSEAVLASASSSQVADVQAAATGRITERTDFSPLAVFVPTATTDASGRASIPVTLPDSLTRYRVLAVAVSGADRSGSGESTITAGRPLTVRSAGPTFLNLGDRLSFPVLVQNTTGAAVTADVVLQTTGLPVSGSAGRRVTVPARGRVEVRIPVTADRVGTATVRMVVVDRTGSAADAATVSLPVYTPATVETVATYGTLEGGQAVRQLVERPAGVFGAVGGLQVSTSSTALQELTDAVLYLERYPYRSADALASRIISIGSLADVLRAFRAPGLPSEQRLRELVAQDVDDLVALQDADGGFRYWDDSRRSEAFTSIQATQALLVARSRGFSVPAVVVSRALRFLQVIDRAIPSDASQQTRDVLHAYALHVRAVGGQRDPAAAAEIVTARGPALSLDAVAWLLPVTDPGAIRDTLLRRVRNAAADDAGTVTFANRVTSDAWTTLQSDRRTDALVLDALLSVDPRSDLVPKVVAGLMSSRTAGRWSGIQENGTILVALRHYFDLAEGVDPDFVAGVWIGGRPAGQHTFSGRSTERATLDLPTAELLRVTAPDVVVQNRGSGRLYYRIAMTTAPQDLRPQALDRGFVVARRYEAVDDPADVRRDGAGVWHVRAGARVRVTLELVSRRARTQVALTDAVPAGLQVLNPALATTPRDLGGSRTRGSAEVRPTSWYPSWYEHQNLRAERAEAFAGVLQGGDYSYSYLTRATVPGTFVAPPARAEQVYTPETFGRSAGDTVVVEG